MASMRCPGCNALISVNESHQNKTLRCSACKTMFKAQISKDTPEKAPSEKKESATGIHVKKGPSKPPPLTKSESKGPPSRRLEKEKPRKRDEGSSVGAFALIGVIVGGLLL